LLRGQRYGLCGHNGAGKTTLMRSIAEDKVEGFPSPDVLKTVFVQHILQGEEGNLSVINFILNGIITFVNALDPRLAHLGRDVVEEGLAKVGFDSERREQAVGTLSGGWKMKLELGRAVLMKADILLLDEPTNHLDKENVKWLEDYLNSQTQITSLIVSHDSGFLDNVCSYIINYESKKLVF
jgi:elongation factor 3